MKQHQFLITLVTGYGSAHINLGLEIKKITASASGKAKIDIYTKNGTKTPIFLNHNTVEYHIENELCNLIIENKETLNQDIYLTIYTE